MQRFSLEKPTLVGLALLLIALIFRLLDIFILRLDERWGEIILSKSIGFMLVLLFVWSTKRKLMDIGLHSQFLPHSLWLSAGLTTLALAIGYGLEFAVLAQQKIQPLLQFTAMDSKVGMTGGLLFAGWLLLGNIVNALMEESLFRGVMIRLFGRSLSLTQANWLQAILFGAWHLPWALKAYQSSEFKTGAEVAFGMISNFLPQLLVGLVWGYMYLKTNNLWAPWISHTLTNSALNFIHIHTVTGLDQGLSVRMVAFVVVMFLATIPIKLISLRLRLPTVRPWGEG